ncbi:MAG: hypothetical protein HQK49_17275 [Oligoflexia bacterium]|nr:hypothetical protein [Oligoflexia bacterium]
MQEQKLIVLIGSHMELKQRLNDFFGEVFVTKEVQKEISTNNNVPVAPTKPVLCPLCGKGSVLRSKYKQDAVYCSEFRNGCKYRG